MTIVILFMGIYYRLPGITADISILLYAAILLAVFKFLGVTLTLPGIAGIMLSTGSALDANILVFERLKEELRGGRVLRQAFDQGWSRAWPSIRDSNIAALITSAILFWFGNTFGATIVKGLLLDPGDRCCHQLVLFALYHTHPAGTGFGSVQTQKFSNAGSVSRREGFL